LRPEHSGDKMCQSEEACPAILARHLTTGVKVILGPVKKSFRAG